MNLSTSIYFSGQMSSSQNTNQTGTKKSSSDTSVVDLTSANLGGGAFISYKQQDYPLLLALDISGTLVGIRMSGQGYLVKNTQSEGSNKSSNKAKDKQGTKLTDKELSSFKRPAHARIAIGAGTEFALTDVFTLRGLLSAVGGLVFRGADNEGWVKRLYVGFQVEGGARYKYIYAGMAFSMTIYSFGNYSIKSLTLKLCAIGGGLPQDNQTQTAITHDDYMY